MNDNKSFGLDGIPSKLLKETVEQTSMEEITKWIDEGSPVDIFYLDFQKGLNYTSV